MNLKTGATACGVALGMTGALALGAGAAHAAPYVRTPFLVVSDPNPFPGEVEGVQGFDYVSLESVTLVGHSDAAITFGDFPTDAAGHFSTTVRIPEDWRCSRHIFVGTGDTAHDTASAEVNVRGCENEGEHHHDHCSRCAGGAGPVFVGGDDDDDDVWGPDHHRHHYRDQDGEHELPGTGGQVAGIAMSGGALIAAGLAITTRRRRRGRNG